MNTAVDVVVVVAAVSDTATAPIVCVAALVAVAVAAAASVVAAAYAFDDAATAPIICAVADLATVVGLLAVVVDTGDVVDIPCCTKYLLLLLLPLMWQGEVSALDEENLGNGNYCHSDNDIIDNNLNPACGPHFRVAKKVLAPVFFAMKAFSRARRFVEGEKREGRRKRRFFLQQFFGTNLSSFFLSYTGKWRDASLHSLPILL